MRDIQWRKTALKQLLAINRNQRITIAYAAARLKNWPACHGVKCLGARQDHYELRVGRHHVVFDVETTIQIRRITTQKR